MEYNRELGISIVAAPGDWLFAKGAIASCRYFMPNSPIQLIVDGDIDTKAAERVYHVTTLRAKDIDNAELRRLGFGWGITKMLAFWRSPTETFLYMDSDAVLWGDLTDRVCLESSDFLVSVRNEKLYSDEEVERWFFDITFIEKHFPKWNWRAALNEFFCPGVFAARRSAFSLDGYLDILRLNEKFPGKFKFGDMGFLNMMVFSGRESGRLRVSSRDFQVIFPDHERSYLERRFCFDSKGVPVVTSGDEQVLHMPDQKPLMDSPSCYSRPMTHFRLMYLRETAGVEGDKATAILRLEDEQYYRLRRLGRKREIQKRILKLVMGDRGEWRRFFYRLLRR